jgi:hypothetical protein
MKVRIPTAKPRNPFATAAHRRHAGSHRRPNGSLRRLAARDLQREIDRMKPPH